VRALIRFISMCCVPTIPSLVFTDTINKGITKLRKYYPKISVLDNRSKALYLALIINPRIKQEGLTSINLSSGISSDIYNRLKTNYNV
jgi:hypothetical protein